MATHGLGELEDDLLGRRPEQEHREGEHAVEQRETRLLCAELLARVKDDMRLAQKRKEPNAVPCCAIL